MQVLIRGVFLYILYSLPCNELLISLKVTLILSLHDEKSLFTSLPELYM